MPAQLHAMTVGHLTIPTGSLLEGRDGSTQVPITSYLITHPRGRVVFDTGMHLDTQRDPAEHIGHWLASFHEFDYSEGEDVASRLQDIDVDPLTVTNVVNSHLHFDHCGGNRLLANATVVVQAAELNAARERGEARGYIADDFETGQPLHLIDGEYDLFGDGSVVAFPTYGHTPGHQSLRVRTETGGEFVLCGDACYLKETLDTMTLPGIVSDRNGFRRSLELFRNFQTNGATIMYGHDLAFWASVPQAPARLG